MLWKFREAKPKDAARIAELVNHAFQVERSFKNGERTDAEQIEAMLARGRFLLMENEDGVVACVYLEPRKDHVLCWSDRRPYFSGRMSAAVYVESSPLTAHADAWSLSVRSMHASRRQRNRGKWPQRGDGCAGRRLIFLARDRLKLAIRLHRNDLWKNSPPFVCVHGFAPASGARAILLPGTTTKLAMNRLARSG